MQTNGPGRGGVPRAGAEGWMWFRRRGSALPLAPDELFHRVAGDVVAVLLRRGLHEVARRGEDRPADAPVLGELGRPHRVDDDPRRVGRVPDLELVLQVQRHVAERPALEADVGPLAVVEPRDVVRRADVDVLLAQLAVDLGGDRLGLGDLLRLQPLQLLHVQEVHVPAHVELHRAVELHAAVLEQPGEHAVGDRGTHLALDVVADDGNARDAELLRPHGVGGDEHRQRVDEGHARVEGGLRVEAVGGLAPDREVGHEHVGAGVPQHLRHVGRIVVGLVDRLAVEPAEPVQRVAALHRHAERRDVADLDRVVLTRRDRLGQVAPDLLRVDVERGHERDVAHVIATEVDVHQAGDAGRRVGVRVVVHALHQRRRAVTHADDRDTDLTHGGSFSRLPCRPVPAQPDAGLCPGPRPGRRARWRSAR